MPCCLRGLCREYSGEGRILWHNTRGTEKNLGLVPTLCSARAGDVGRGSTNEEVETSRTPVTADAELCGIDACWRINSSFCIYAEGRALCQLDFAHQILRIRRNRGADAALARIPVFSVHGGRIKFAAPQMPFVVRRIHNRPAVRSPRFLACRHLDARLTRALRVIGEGSNVFLVQVTRRNSFSRLKFAGRDF